MVGGEWEHEVRWLDVVEGEVEGVGGVEAGEMLRRC